jgi:peptide deformylase
MRGKNIRIKAWGLLARVFPHEVDYLDGKLFIDRAARGKTKEVSEK